MARKKKDCGARQCSNRIKASHYFCEACMKRIPSALRTDFYDAYGRGDGKAIMDLSNQIREHLDTGERSQPKQEEKMATGKSDLIEVEVEFRMEKGGGIAVFNGDFKEDEYGNQREDWIWLPKSLVERDGNIFTMPEWLAQDKGLI